MYLSDIISLIMRDIIQILKDVGAILENDHFVGTTGGHLPVYLNKDILYTHTQDTSEVGKLFAEKYKDKDIDIVVGPAMGGIILAQWAAFHLSEVKGKEVLSAYAEKDGEGGFVLKRGYDKLVKGKNILLVEDLTTTGTSIKKVAEVVASYDGNIVDICVMVNKDEKINSDSIGFPFSSLGFYEVPSYPAEECPLCKDNVPVNTKIGHGKKFLESKEK